ncbi:MAG TPA: hypothetical protein VGO93_31750 [Candidatus Xenobia bacterium]|jgi:hypothetical protein
MKRWLVVLALLAAPAWADIQWVDHQDPAGFFVRMPTGWEAEAKDDGKVFIHSANGQLTVAAVPIVLQENTNVPLSVPWFHGAKVVDEVRVSNEIDVAKLLYHGDSGVCVAEVMYWMHGGSGMLYAIAAPQDLFPAKKPVLLDILKSFRYTSKSGIDYVPWEDPVEHAFTVEVPDGWHVLGGTFRYAPIDVRTQVQLISPDGRIKMHVGDARLGSFVGEGPATRMRGLHAGDKYEVNGVTTTILPYVDGAQFSKQYVEHSLKKSHPDLEVTGTHDRPEWVAEFQHGGEARVTVGETDFRYTDGKGNPMQGMCVTATTLRGQGMSASWQGYPCSFGAPTDQFDKARDIFEHLVLHFKENPQWTASQQQETDRFTRLVMANHEMAIAEMNHIYERFSHQVADNGHQWDNIIANLQDVRGPDGETATVSAGHNYYWKRGTEVVGTEGNRPPDVTFSAMDKL